MAGNWILTKKVPNHEKQPFSLCCTSSDAVQSRPCRMQLNNGTAGMGGMVGTDADTGGAATMLGEPMHFRVYNARHVGTLSAGSKHLREHIIIRSGDLYELADAGCASLEALKVASIIDLRDEPDLSNRPDRDCGIAERKLVQLSLPKLLPPKRR